MRIVRLLFVLAVLGGTAWVLTRSISVESSDSQVRITIDRQKLRQAGSDLKTRSKQAVNKVGQALEQAGQTLENQSDEQDTLLTR